MSTIKVSPEIQWEIDRCRQFMLEHEYTSNTAFGYSTHLSRFLRQAHLPETESFQERISSFIKSQRDSNPENLNSSRAAIYLYYKMITGESFPKRLSKEPNPEVDIIMRKFYEYSINVKRIQPNTALSDISRVQKFLEHIPECKLDRLDSITAQQTLRTSPTTAVATVRLSRSTIHTPVSSIIMKIAFLLTVTPLTYKPQAREVDNC